MTGIESAIVTGASGGLGQAITYALLESGRRVVGIDLDAAALESQRASLPDGSFVPLVGNVTHPQTWADAAAHAETLGRTAVLINNAGISPKRDGMRVPGVDTDLEMWQEVLDINLTGAFLGIKAVAPLMKEHGKGRIVNISSMAGRTLASLAGIPYTVSKAGMLGLTRGFAGELGPSGITVNAVAPGRIATPMLAAGATSMNADVLDRIPVHRFGTPEDIAAVVRFLAGDGSGFVNGACIDANGGQFMA
jgi:3-oxoacyl-[acyl-carrier protein] reductase